MFCQEHIRRYNEAWDYLSGRSAEEIETLQHQIVYGNRPTWPRAHFMAMQASLLEQAAQWRHSAGMRPMPEKPIPIGLREEERKALAILSLGWPVSLEEIKRQYRKMAKRFHPDSENGHAERFRRINEAYRLLVRSPLFT